MNNKFFVVGLIIVISIIIIFGLSKNKVENISKNESEGNTQLNLNYIQFEDRVSIKEDDWLLIGNTEAELENDFYDFRLRKIDRDKIEIHINKLWYKEFNENYLEEEYLVDIVHKLMCLLLNTSDEETQKTEYHLYSYIKETYIHVKKSEKYNNKIKLGDLMIESSDEEKILKIIICKGES